jgi:GTP-binding protein
LQIFRYYRGAAEGKGLGHYFLRHIERNSTLLFLVPVDTPDIKGEYDILVNELTKYNPEMLDKERLLVISKCDMLDDELTAELKEELDVSLKVSRTCLYRLLHNKG